MTSRRHRGVEFRADLGDLPVGDQHVDLFTLAARSGGRRGSGPGHSCTVTASSVPTSRWNSTAIRTCTPLETCCSTADCVESATENEISMPRSIGPGASPPHAGGAAPAVVGEPVEHRYSRVDGKKPPFIRSACTRSIITASAAGSSASRSCETVTGQSETPPATTSAVRPARPRRRGVEQGHIGAGHPAVQDVADDHHPAARDVAEALAQGQRVEQRLGGVLVGAVAGVDDAGPGTVGLQRPLRQLLGSPGRRCRMINASAPAARNVSAVSRSDSPCGHRGPRRADVDHVGAHPLARDLERHPGAGRVLVEHRDHGAPAQRSAASSPRGRAAPAGTGRRCRGSRWPRRGSGPRRTADA